MAVTATTAPIAANRVRRKGEAGFWRRLGRDLRRNRWVYLMLLPVVGYYLIFHYGPMYGLQIAFRDYYPAQGIWGSPWVGLEHLRVFFKSFYFSRLITNTLSINVLDLVLGFPAPIILALLLNEVRLVPFKRLVQTITYMPHFVSVVVVVGIIADFTARDGVLNQLLGGLGIGPTSFMQKPEWFQITYVLSGIWQHVGWGSILYMAALTAIDPALYEAAMVDGAGRWRQLIHITLPGIAPTIIILLILRLGSMMAVGFEKIILMYNPMTYETGDVIASYIYRKGLQEMAYSFGAAVGLFNALINFGLVVIANAISRRTSETSLW